MTTTELPLETAPASRRTLVATAVHADPIDPITLFGAARAAGLDAALWHEPATGRALVGVDHAARLELVGADRWEALSDQRAALLASTETIGPASGSALAGPILLGGAPFRAHPSTDPRWTGFRSAVFDLPRLLVASHAGQTVVTSVGPLDGDAKTSPLAMLERLLGVWASPTAGVPAGLSTMGSYPDRAAWGASVARIAGAVGRGRLDKVVLARRVDLRAVGPIDLVSALRRLESAELAAGREDGPRLASTLFAFGHGRRTFLGSSPERLASVRGRTLRTMALAGTGPRGADPTDDEAMAATLLASEKDREEHAVVTGMLRSTLAPLVEDLALPRAPRIVRSTTLQHLVTDVAGTLGADTGLLDVVARLHPTPAVAGWPLDPALELLDDEEATDRGWYAGPVGWIDRSGDGDIQVAIRSAVVEDRDASLFAGCGIVADSEADREWDESTLKLRVMGDGLGWAAR